MLVGITKFYSGSIHPYRKILRNKLPKIARKNGVRLRREVALYLIGSLCETMDVLEEVSVTRIVRKTVVVYIGG